MKRYVLTAAVLLAVAGVAIAATTLSPVPPTTPAPQGAKYGPGATAATATLALNGTACTAPGGASCTIILASTDISAFDHATIYVASTSGTLDDVLVEMGPDGSSWTAIATLSAVTAQKIVGVTDHYNFVRVEARSAAGGASTVSLSLYRP